MFFLSQLRLETWRVGYRWIYICVSRSCLGLWDCSLYLLVKLSLVHSWVVPWLVLHVVWDPVFRNFFFYHCLRMLYRCLISRSWNMILTGAGSTMAFFVLIALSSCLRGSLCNVFDVLIPFVAALTAILSYPLKIIWFNQACNWRNYRLSNINDLFQCKWIVWSFPNWGTMADSFFFSNNLGRVL